MLTEGEANRELHAQRAIPGLPPTGSVIPQSLIMNGSTTYSCVPASLWKTILY